jgi:hypothetical protein
VVLVADKFMRNLYLPISIIIAGLIIAGALIYTKKPAEKTILPEETLLSEQKEEEIATEEILVTEKDHVRGDFSAPVTIMEYSDFRNDY